MDINSNMQAAAEALQAAKKQQQAQINANLQAAADAFHAAMQYAKEHPEALESRYVDIYIREINSSREIKIPILPDKIQYKSGAATVATHDILKKGPVDLPLGVGLEELKFESFFPGPERTDLGMMRDSYHAPSYYHNIIKDWKAKGTDLNVMVTGYPINFDCYVADYNAVPQGGFRDIYYEIHLKQDEFITVKVSTEESNSGGTGDKPNQEESKRPAQTTTTYTIKAGDCMWDIAQKFLGDGSKWPEIYKLNKTVLDNTAKKYGHSSNDGTVVFPGTTIKIPSKK